MSLWAFPWDQILLTPGTAFATLQIPFKNHVITTLLQPYFLRTQWRKCTSWKEKVPESATRVQLSVLGKLNVGVLNLQINGGLCKAAAVVEHVQSDEGMVHDFMVYNQEAGAFHSSDDDSDGMDVREKSRRLKISKANKGKVPWNKGRKHSEGKGLKETPFFHLFAYCSPCITTSLLHLYLLDFFFDLYYLLFVSRDR